MLFTRYGVDLTCNSDFHSEGLLIWWEFVCLIAVSGSCPCKWCPETPGASSSGRD